MSSRLEEEPPQRCTGGAEWRQNARRGVVVIGRHTADDVQEGISLTIRTFAWRVPRLGSVIGVVEWPAIVVMGLDFFMKGFFFAAWSSAAAVTALAATQLGGDCDGEPSRSGQQ